MALNPNFPIWYHSTFFENHYRNGEYQAALARAHDMNTPGWYWSYLYFAMAYGQLGDRENGKAAVEDLLAVYPTFAEDARDVLAKWYFIDDHVELILEGLRKAGLDIPEPAASQDAAAE